MNFNPLQSNYPSLMRYPQKNMQALQLTAVSSKSPLKKREQSKLGVKSGIITFQSGKGKAYMWLGYAGGVLCFEDGLMSVGRCIGIYPTSVVFNACLRSGKLNSWCVTYCENKFILVSQYKDGLLEGLQYNYRLGRNILTRSKYRKGKLVQIDDGTLKTYETLLKELGKDVGDLVDSTVGLKCFPECVPTIRTEKSVYFGEQTNQLPNGFGILFSRPEIFLGSFQNGLLHGIGAMTLQNNSNYFGEFKHGKMCGYGRFENGPTLAFAQDGDDIAKPIFLTFLERSLPTGVACLIEIDQALSQIHSSLVRIYFPKQSPVAPIEVVEAALSSNQKELSQHSAKQTSQLNQSSNGEPELKKNHQNNLRRTGDSPSEEVKFGLKVDPLTVTSKGKKIHLSSTKSKITVSDEDKNVSPQSDVKADLSSKKVLNDFEWREIVGEELEEDHINEEHGFPVPKTVDRYAQPSGNGTLGEKKDQENAHMPIEPFFRKDVPAKNSKDGLKEDRMIGKIHKA